MRDTMEKNLYDTLVNGFNPGHVKGIATMKTLITIKEADNGFVAEITGGGIVVGKTLSEICEAAQQAVATATLKNEDDGSVKEVSGAGYAKQAAGQPTKFKHNISASNPLGYTSEEMDEKMDDVADQK